jgi:hypothetical protein
MSDSEQRIDEPPGGNPDWWKGVGLYVELSPVQAHLYGHFDPGAPDEDKVLFAPLSDDVFNIEKWVRDQLAEWNYPAQPSDVIEEIVANLRLQQTRPASTMKRERFDLDRAKPTDWLWDKRIYLNGFNIQLGREGVGKGTQAAWVATQLMLGKLPGTFEGVPVNVAIIGAEDDFYSQWQMRILASALEEGLQIEKAERLFKDRVFRYTMPDGRTPNLNDKVEIMRAAHEDEVKLIYFDSLLDSLPPGTNVWQDASAREGLLPAKEIGEELECAVVGSLHPNKKGESFDRLVSGARAFNGVSRSSLILEEHPEDDDQRVLLRGKGNYSEKPEPLEWELVGRKFELRGKPYSQPTVRGMGPSDVTEADLLARFSGDRDAGKGSSKIDAATKYLEEALADEQPHQSGPILAALNDMGCDAKSTQGAARKRARVRTFQEDGHWWMQKKPVKP